MIKLSSQQDDDNKQTGTDSMKKHEFIITLPD